MTQELALLNQKIDLLLNRYADLEQENRVLKETISQQNQRITDLNGHLSDLEQNMVKAGNDLDAGKDWEKMRVQLDQVIGEIDKILITLND